MSEELIDHDISFKVTFVDSNLGPVTRTFTVYSDAERYALERSRRLPNKITIEQIDTKIYSVEKILRTIDPLAPKPDIVILHSWTVIPHNKGPFLSGLATNHPKWPGIIKKEMSSGNIIGKKGYLVVTKSGTKYDLQVENVSQEVAKNTLLACLTEI
jgi:hypothetical protein